MESPQSEWLTLDEYDAAQTPTERCECGATDWVRAERSQWWYCYDCGSDRPSVVDQFRLAVARLVLAVERFQADQEEHGA